MGSVSPLLSFLLMVVSGWVNRHQLLVIEFLQAENRLLKERLRGHCQSLTLSWPMMPHESIETLGPICAQSFGHNGQRAAQFLGVGAR
jgi:hypothetical protein